MAHDAQVVRDEHVAQTALALQVAQQVHDLALHRDIERRHRFIADDQRRIERQRAGDADPLPLPARHLMRVAVGEIRVEPAQRQQLVHPRIAPRRIGLDPVHHHRLAEDRADLLARVQRAVRVLEDDLDLPAQRHQLLAPELGDIDAVIADFAGGRLFETQDAAAHRGFAAAALADEAQCLAAADRQIDPVHRFDVADMPARDHPLRDREMHA